jgi:hypothetical protein
MFAGGVLLLNRAVPVPRVAPPAQSRNLVRCGNAVRFGVPLGTPMLDAFSMTCVAIQTFFGMWMRQKVLHGFAVTHFAEVTSLLVRKERRTEEQD